MKKRQLRVLLVQPEAKLSLTTTDTYSPPIGLASIGTAIKKYHPDVEIKIIGNYNGLNHQEQVKYLRSFKPHIAGYSPTISSQENAYELAEIAENEFNSLNILGGVNSTQLWKQILTNRKFIGAVAMYDGHNACSEIIKRLKEGKKIENIPNVAYRIGEEIKNPEYIFIPSIEKTPDPDYSLLDLDPFLELTQKKGFGKAISYSAGTGCSKRAGKSAKEFWKWEEFQHFIKKIRACSFCGRNEIRYETLKYERESKRVNYLNELKGITGFFNTHDSVDLTPENSQKKWEEFWFRLFINSEPASKQKTIDILKRKYSPNLVFQVGIESANPDMLKCFGKVAHNTDYYMKMTELLAKNNVQLHATFVLGGPGETKKSLKETTELIKELSTRENVTWIGASPELLLPGSPDYRNCLIQNPYLREKYENEDLIDIVESHKDMLKYFSPTIARDDVLESIQHAFSYAKKNNPNMILDGKGLTYEEEKLVGCHRPYIEDKNWKFKFA